jgi:mannose-6-phosphate isomerase-like protein (cupin superfamily)
LRRSASAARKEDIARPLILNYTQINLYTLKTQVAMTSSPSSRVRVIDSAIGCPEIPIVEGEGNARVVLSPHNGSTFRSFQLVSLKRNARTIGLKHASNCVYYVIEGAGAIVDAIAGARLDLAEGGMVHIDAGDLYRIEAGAEGIKVIGGPCPPDESLYAGLVSAEA